MRGAVRTEVTADDRRMIHRLLVHLGPHAKLEPLRADRSLLSGAVWHRIVSQVCVMGSSRGMANIERDSIRRRAFAEDMSLRSLNARHYSQRHVAAVLKAYGATRFPNVAAKRLKAIIASPTAVTNGRCVLLNGLRGIGDAMVVRDTLIARCPIFKLKSASDFMIGVGLSHDVVALDVRVVGALQRYCGYNLTAGQVQGRRDVYLSVEEALRQVCRDGDAPLALLDRVLFQFSGMSALEFALKLP